MERFRAFAHDGRQPVEDKGDSIGDFESVEEALKRARLRYEYTDALDIFADVHDTKRDEWLSYVWREKTETWQQLIRAKDQSGSC